jgi:hypothetical protein
MLANQDMVMVTAPPGSGPGTTLSITHNGASFHVRVPNGVRAGGQFIANVPRMTSQPAANNHNHRHAIQQQQHLMEQQQMQQIQQRQQQRQLEQMQMNEYQQDQAPRPTPPPQRKGRGQLVQLPDGFLRPPGWTPNGAASERANMTEGEMSDEQLAILLQVICYLFFHLFLFSLVGSDFVLTVSFCVSLM